MICARVVSGVVLEVAAIPSSLAALGLDRIFPSDAGWQDVTAADPQPEPGWVVEGDGFVAPEPVVLPPLPPSVTAPQFLALFTPAEEVAVMAGAQQNPALLGFVVKLVAYQTVQLDDPRVQAGVAALVQAALISSTRAAQVLAGVTADAVQFDTANVVFLT